MLRDIVQIVGISSTPTKNFEKIASVSSLSLKSNRIELASTYHMYDSTETLPSFQRTNAPTCASTFACMRLNDVCNLSFVDFVELNSDLNRLV